MSTEMNLAVDYKRVTSLDKLEVGESEEHTLFDFLPAVFPLSETGVQGKKIGNTPGVQKLSHLLLMSWVHRDGVPLSRKKWLIYRRNRGYCQRHQGNPLDL